jgi:hypothetical protein
MRKIFKFRILKDYPPYIEAGEILEGYYSTFFSHPVVVITAKDGQGCGMARESAEQLEFIREVDMWKSPAIPCS